MIALDALPLFMSPPVVAEMLGIEPAKVIGWIRAGELVASDITMKPGGRARWRISRDDLQQFLLSRSNRGHETSAPSARRRRKSTQYVPKYY